MNTNEYFVDTMKLIILVKNIKIVSLLQLLIISLLLNQY